MASETFKKRQKEMARREKQQKKAARRMERRDEKARTGSKVEGENPNPAEPAFRPLDSGPGHGVGGHSLGIPPENRGVVLSERSESKGDGDSAPGLPGRAPQGPTIL